MLLLNLKMTIFSKLFLFRFLVIAVWLPLLTFVGMAQEVQNNDGSDIFPVPDAYKTEGIPPIKKSEVENLFYDPSAIRSNLIWDADSKNRKLLVTDEKNYIYMLDAPLAQPVKLIDKIVPQSVKFSPNGQSFAYTSDYEDEDNYQLHFYDLKEKKPKKLVSLTGKDESIDSIVWSRSGDSLFYPRVDYDAKVTKLCQYDFRVENCFPVQLKGVWNVIQADENRVLIKHSKSPSSQLIYLYDVRSKNLMPIDETGNGQDSFMVGDRVFWSTEGNEKCKKEPCLLSLNLKNNKVDQVSLPESISSIDGVKISPEGNNLLIQETKNGVDYLHVLEIKNGKIVKEFPAFISENYVVWKTRWLSDREISYTLENNGKPASIQSYNLDTKKITDWTKEKVPAQLENKVKAPEIFKWKSFDNKEISGYIVRPQNSEKKSPVMVFVHGGPPILDKPFFNSQDIRLSSNLNLTIIHTNIRGSNGFGKEFLDADNKEKRGDAVKDIQSLLDWIEKQPELDAKQIYLRGESYGGFIVLSTAMQEPSRVKAVIAEYPLVSIKEFLSQSYIDEIAKNEYGDPKDTALMNKLDSLSPLTNVDRWNKIPLFLTRGKLDSRVPEKDVIDLKNQLQNIGTELWFIYSLEDGHGFSSRYVFAAMYQFLKKQINVNKEEKSK